MPDNLSVSVKKADLSDRNLPFPTRATEGAAGFDLRADLSRFAANSTDLVLQPGARMLIPTGLVFEIPSGFEGQIRPRSGLSLRYGITVLNAPGTIDSDYRGEVGVIIANFGETSFEIEHGQRIAQIVFQKLPDVCLVEVESLSESNRGDGGFGSSGLA